MRFARLDLSNLCSAAHYYRIDVQYVVDKTRRQLQANLPQVDVTRMRLGDYVNGNALVMIAI